MKNIIKFYVFAILFGVILTTVGIVHAGSKKLEVRGEIYQPSATPPSHSEFKLKLELKDGYKEFKGQVVGEHKIYIDVTSQEDDLSDFENDTFTLSLDTTIDEVPMTVDCTMVFNSTEFKVSAPLHAIITYKAEGRLEIKDYEIKKARLTGCTVEEALGLAHATDGDTVTITDDNRTAEVAQFKLEEEKNDFDF